MRLWTFRAVDRDDTVVIAAGGQVGSPQVLQRLAGRSMDWVSNKELLQKLFDANWVRSPLPACLVLIGPNPSIQIRSSYAAIIIHHSHSTYRKQPRAHWRADRGFPIRRPQALAVCADPTPEQVYDEPDRGIAGAPATGLAFSDLGCDGAILIGTTLNTIIAIGVRRVQTSSLPMLSPTVVVVGSVQNPAVTCQSGSLSRDADEISMLTR